MARFIFPRQAFVPVFADDDCAMPEYPWGLDEVYRSMVPVGRHRPVLSLSSRPLRPDDELDGETRERILDRLVSDFLSAASPRYDFASFLHHLSGSGDLAKSNKHPSSEGKSSTSENRCPKSTTQSPTLCSPSDKGHEQHDSASSEKCLTSSSPAVKPVEKSDDRFDLSLQIGDFPPENVKVSVTDRKLNIRAHCDERDEKTGWVGHKQFEYNFLLPENASIDSLTSSYDTEGVLSITAAKTDSNTTRQVPVQIRDALESVKSAPEKEHEMEQTTPSVNDGID